MEFKSFRDLEIYKKSHQLALDVHTMSLDLPKFEMYEIGSQIRRSSKSIKSNIVEGFGRRHYKLEFLKFLTYSLASCDETTDHLDTLYETKSLSNFDQYSMLSKEYKHLGKMINNFIKTVRIKHKSTH